MRKYQECVALRTTAAQRRCGCQKARMRRQRLQQRQRVLLPAPAAAVAAASAPLAPSAPSPSQCGTPRCCGSSPNTVSGCQLAQRLLPFTFQPTPGASVRLRACIGCCPVAGGAGAPRVEQTAGMGGPKRTLWELRLCCWGLALRTERMWSSCPGQEAERLGAGDCRHANIALQQRMRPVYGGALPPQPPASSLPLPPLLCPFRTHSGIPAPPTAAPLSLSKHSDGSM